MATPSENLAVSLALLKELQDQGRQAIRSSDLPRIHRERLTRSGFLHEVMKGWYVPTRPDEASAIWVNTFVAGLLPLYA